MAWAGAAAAIVGALASVAGTVISTVQSNKASKRQEQYQQQLLAQEQAAQAEEDRLTREAAERQRAYGASLLNTDTALTNTLSGGLNEDEIGDSTIMQGSLLGSTQKTPTGASLFS